jgi:CDP-diglyceride synthetase
MLGDKEKDRQATIQAVIMMVGWLILRKLDNIDTILLVSYTVFISIGFAFTLIPLFVNVKRGDYSNDREWTMPIIVRGLFSVLILAINFIVCDKYFSENKLIDYGAVILSLFCLYGAVPHIKNWIAELKYEKEHKEKKIDEN